MKTANHPFDIQNHHYRIHEVNLTGDIRISYFDTDWELKESSLMQLTASPEVLCQFRPTDSRKLLELYRTYFL